MAFLQNLTDDQTALLGCAGALLAAFITMSLSYHVGNAVRGGHTTQNRIVTERRPAAPVAEERRRAA